MRIGAYEVLGNIGVGGMGVVVKARATDGRLVAIKTTKRRDRTALARFERERAILEKLGEADGFVPLVDWGDDATHGPYFVMPFVEGGNLADRLERGRLAVAEAVALVASLASAMGRAHERGILHRDLKPANVLFTHRGAESGSWGRPLIADLGLGKVLDDDQPPLSRSGEIRGTVGYMSLEQMSASKNLGPPTDVFALGAILYECITGVAPFEGATVLELHDRLVRGDYVRLDRARSDVPRHVAAAVERSLATAPEARFADGAALAAALGQPTATRRGSHLRLLALSAALFFAALVAVLTSPGRRPPPTDAVPVQVAPDDRRDPDALVLDAARFEREQRWSDAHAAWSRLLDSVTASPEKRSLAATKREALARAVPPGPPRVWRLLVLAFTRTTVVGHDVGGTRPSTYDVTLGEGGAEEIRRSVARLVRDVSQLTRGCVKIEPTIRLLDAPVPRLASTAMNGVTIDRDQLLSQPETTPGPEYECTLVYVHRGSGANVPPVTHEADQNTFGPKEVLSIFVFPALGDLDRRAAGESLELGCFLELAEWILVKGQGWCPAFAPKYRQTIEPAHVTERMWASLTAREHVPNVWNAAHVREWRVAGPFSFEGEADDGLGAPTPVDKVSDLRDPSAKARVMKSAMCVLRLPAGRYPYKRLNAVAETWLHVPAALRAKLAFWADDDVRLEIDGAQVYERRYGWRARAWEESVSVDLDAGWHRLRAKCSNHGSAFELGIRVTDTNDRPIPGLHVSADKSR